MLHTYRPCEDKPGKFEVGYWLIFSTIRDTIGPQWTTLKVVGTELRAQKLVNYLNGGSEGAYI